MHRDDQQFHNPIAPEAGGGFLPQLLINLIKQLFFSFAENDDNTKISIWNESNTQLNFLFNLFP